MRRLASTGLLLFIVATHARAQTLRGTLRGTVRDSASRSPIAGAVLTLLDAGGRTITRTLTTERGQYRVERSAGAQRMRIVRIGFRPRVVDLAGIAPTSDTLDVDLASLPTMLEAVEVNAAAGCPQRSDRIAAFALWEQARAGLLATVVARDANPAAMVRLTFDRTMDGTSDRIKAQSVRIDSSDHLTASFEASRSAADFVRLGFMQDSAGVSFFYGPDADVLLDDAFGAGYCFQLANPDRARPRQVGLAFSAPEHRQNRIDIEGTLWVDTSARALRDLDFRYRGLSGQIESIHPGGRTAFREMSNGTVLIDRWALRLPFSWEDTVPVAGGLDRVRVRYGARETGGELARVRWPSGELCTASLGVLRAHLVDRAGGPATTVRVHLDNTDYGAAPDANGDVEIRDLAPGPYVASIVDSETGPIGLRVRTPLAFAVERGAVVEQTLIVPAAREYTRARCTGARDGDEAAPWLVARVVSSDAGVAGANWELRRELGGGYEAVESRRADSEGNIHYCMIVGRGDVLVSAWRDNDARPVSVRRELSRPGTKLTLELPR